IVEDAPRTGSFWTALAKAEPVHGSTGRQSTDIANLLYTSGTTSTPKAVIHTHGMRASIAATMAHCFELSINDVAVGVSPLFHTGGLRVFCNAMFCGGGVHLVEKWDLDAFAQLLKSEPIT